MGKIQSSFNQMLTIQAGAVMGAKHIEEQNQSNLLNHTKMVSEASEENHRITHEEAQLEKEKKSIDLQRKEWDERADFYNEKVENFHKKKDSLSKDYVKQREKFFGKAHDALMEEKDMISKQLEDYNERIAILADRKNIYNAKVDEINKIGKTIGAKIKLNNLGGKNNGK